MMTNVHCLCFVSQVGAPFLFLFFLNKNQLHLKDKSYFVFNQSLVNKCIKDSNFVDRPKQKYITKYDF